jgi:hypothetical protein
MQIKIPLRQREVYRDCLSALVNDIFDDPQPDEQQENDGHERFVHDLFRRNTARPRTIEGASGLMNLTMVPMWVFSGIFFSSSRFPEAIQPVVQALPLTAVNDALRANLLEGAGLTQLAPELAIIAAWLVGSFAIALKLFRWT